MDGASDEDRSDGGGDYDHGSADAPHEKYDRRHGYHRNHRPHRIANSGREEVRGPPDSICPSRVDYSSSGSGSSTSPSSCTAPSAKTVHKREPRPPLSNSPSSVASSHPLLSAQTYRRCESTPMSRDWRRSVRSSTVTVPVAGSPSSSDPRKGQARTSYPSLPLRLSVSRSSPSTFPRLSPSQ